MDIPIQKPLVDVFRWRVTKSPNLIVHKFQQRETTYSQFDIFANKVAQGLIKEGCKPNSRVAYLAKNSDLYFEFLYGTLKSNTVAVGINWRLAAPEVAYILNDSKSEMIFVGPEFYGLINQIKDEIPHVKKIISMGDPYGQWQDYSSWRDSQSDVDPLISVSIEDDVIQLYTSGTTGHPKGVQLSNINFTASAEMSQKTYYQYFDEGTPNMVCMPIFHVAGTNMGIAGIISGSKNIIVADLDPGIVLDLIEKEKIVNTLFVPAVILFLIQHPKVEQIDFSSLKTVIYGASPIAEATLNKAIQIMGCDFWQVYGLTETNGTVTILDPQDHHPSKNKLRSCGKPGPGVEIKIVDESGNKVSTGEVGEILIKSATNMKGYWNKSEATLSAFKEDWFISGDAGYYDEEGFLYIHDRVKDMIVSGAENIYPAEVDNALMSHPEIIDAAVIGIPDEKWGEVVKGFVVIGKDSQLDEHGIISYARTQISGFKCPKSIDFVNELPRNPSGKILRRELRAPYWEGRDRNVS